MVGEDVRALASADEMSCMGWVFVFDFQQSRSSLFARFSYRT